MHGRMRAIDRDLIAKGIMASGHVNRANRPNTWLHRPMLHTFKKVLANSEPSTHGGKADNHAVLSAYDPKRTRQKQELQQCGLRPKSPSWRSLLGYCSRFRERAKHHSVMTSRAEASRIPAFARGTSAYPWGPGHNFPYPDRPYGDPDRY